MMSYKYYLGLAPEENVIDPIILYKYRAQRIKDDTL